MEQFARLTATSLASRQLKNHSITESEAFRVERGFAIDCLAKEVGSCRRARIEHLHSSKRETAVDHAFQRNHQRRVDGPSSRETRPQSEKAPPGVGVRLFA